MDYTIQDRSVLSFLWLGAEDPPAKDGAVEEAGIAWDCEVGREEEVGGCGAEVADDGFVAGGPGVDRISGKLGGVDDGEGACRGGEDVAAAGFTGRDGAGEANEEHV